MEVLTEQKGISVGEGIKLFFKINILQILFTIPFNLLGICFEESGLNAIAPYINGLGEIAAYIYIIRKIIKEINLKENFKLKIQYKPKLKEYIYVILALLGYLFIYGNTIELLLSNIPESQWVEEYFSTIPIPLLIISVSIVAPIFEEIIYRGIILEQLDRRYGMIKAIIVSSLLFGIVHLNIHQGVNAFFIGIVAGFIYIKTNSLLLSMFLHFANNSLVTISDFIPFLDSSNSKFSVVELVCGVIMLLIAYKFFNNIEVDLSRKFKWDIKSKIKENKLSDTNYNS
ncbi:CPBP family intramembrane glutamic endopeptidase [Clostridium sp. ZS2-4]|uniref:CPBP family intramembrane glutamic endopeptidase n=1 Tax=Clostridium sp. ZS2-4 TaxID=2987703 RepID=UPI00227A76E0|nr:CPBP family intramembrane glutamic endopeptidase [Clostridium sp. ZS2-4]MCY6356050.1 CPBP family intramembrane metalloprotease [Clostridium sp. ZS2-4]